jgi:hypothetical protein
MSEIIYNNNLLYNDKSLFKLNHQINYNILFNILYRYDIDINNDIHLIIDKFFNLNDIEEPYNSIFQNYMIFDTNNNLFWITLTLYFINQLDLCEFLLSLFDYSLQLNIYNKKIYYNDLKKKNKDELIKELKYYIDISNLHMICFLKFFLHTFQ